MSSSKPTTGRRPFVCADAVAMRPDVPVLTHHWPGKRDEVEPADRSTNLIIQPNPVE
jgi:hypothetical protein